MLEISLNIRKTKCTQKNSNVSATEKKNKKKKRNNTQEQVESDKSIKVKQYYSTLLYSRFCQLVDIQQECSSLTQTRPMFP